MRRDAPSAGASVADVRRADSAPAGCRRPEATPGNGRSPGTASAQTGVAIGQRVRNTQPVGGAAMLGT